MDELEQILAQPGFARELRVAIVGVGNMLNGDDAAGVLVARGLIDQMRRRKANAGDSTVSAESALPDAAASEPATRPIRTEMETSGRLLVIDGGPAPESFSGPLRRFQPGLVVLVDAAEMGEPPGAVRVFDWADALGMSASTHTMPPSMLARFLVSELNCRVLLVGIQPAGLDFDQPVSAEVRRAVRAVTARLAALLAG